MLFVDVSSNNHPNSTAIDWSLLVTQGVQGAIIKVSEADYENPYAHADYLDAEAVGIACLGLYDFARQDLESGARDASLFLSGLNALGGIRPGTRLVLDIEEHADNGPQVDPHADLAAYCLDWASVIWPVQERSDTALRPLLYSRRDYLAAHNLDNSTLAAVFDLWLVGQPGDSSPSGWPAVAMWQTGTKDFAGATGPVDTDIFPSRAYDWLSRSWAYQTSPLNVHDTPDVDPSLDTPAILRHMADTLRALHADTAILITRGGLIG